MSFEKKPEITNVPPASGNISFGNYAEDLRNAYGNSAGNGNPWLAVARRALKLAPLVLPEDPSESHEP